MQVQAAENAFKRPGIHMVAQQFYQEVSAAALQEVCVQEVCLQLCQEVSAACDRFAGAESEVCDSSVGNSHRISSARKSRHNDRNDDNTTLPTTT